MKINLNWKKKWLDDKSGYWYSAKVSNLNWEYIIDTQPDGFDPRVYYNNFDDDACHITNKTYRTLDGAKNICEKHLNNITKKFKDFINK